MCIFFKKLVRYFLRHSGFLFLYINFKWIKYFCENLLMERGTEIQSLRWTAETRRRKSNKNKKRDKKAKQSHGSPWCWP
ncbi:hypothetical protein L2E82_06234 [Cichorium intybus]|uniref:Uncharacterized protein n=1 Tax=Cichorium intybus TaxID=13427 RepID=A0ACB9HBP4_CICIN|nr:hypothetical protein L2E82_06234 [Cichorium intybus]